jgi:pteridine reductase
MSRQKSSANVILSRLKSQARNGLKPINWTYINNGHENMNENKPAVLITGAAKRIGKEVATQLRDAGFNVIIHCNRSIKEAEVLAAGLNSERDGSAKVISADLTNMVEVKRLGKEAIDAFGRLDMLVNNASSFYPTIVDDVSESQWEDLFSTNLKAPFFLIQSVKKELSKNKGNIVNMVDIHAERPLLNYPVYCMAKAGLVMLTKSLSRELAPNIRVNGIAPGAILWHENELSDNDKNQVLSEISLNRLGAPTDIAQAILYFSQASYVTGQILAIDGGRSTNGGSKA